MRGKHEKGKSYVAGVDDEPVLEKGDLKAMFLAAFAVYLPALLGITAILLGIVWLFFLR